jgi:hypothetical protein
MPADKNKVALLVHSCDRYQFLYKGFEAFFSRHWNFDIPCNYYFATEEIDAEVKGFMNIKSGKGEWTNRLSALLKTIPEDYIIYFQEDMWLTKDVNKYFFEQIFKLTLQYDWKQVKLHSSEVYKTNETPLFIEGFNIAKVDNHASDFLMSHQVTLWNKKYLMDQLPNGEHPWRNERKGSKRLKQLNPDIYLADYFAENGKPEINKNINPVKRSEYKTISVNGTLSNEVVRFIKLFEEGNREEKKYAAQLLHHYENGLTHDGKAKPRKEDVFKKIKRWLLQK